MAAKSSVFLLGPGFIGLEILGELLREGYPVTTLIRREEARASLEKLGSKTVLGSLDDGEVIRKAAAAADIVIHTATADHKPSAVSILEGIKERVNSGKSSIYIHTSGCSLITDESNGEYASDKIYDDNKPETIDSVADDAPHRSIDLAILERRKELGAEAKISIVFPPVIYGLGKDNRLSIQIPTMARFAIKHGYAGYVGKGEAVWGQVHVADLARGYMTILHYMESTPGNEILKNPYFFVENGEEHSWKQCAEEIGKALHKAGKIQDPNPREISTDLYVDLFQEWSLAVIGQNARNRANRLRALGWQPTEKSTFDSFVTDELPILLAEKGEYKGYGAAVAS
ncbi:NAD(P)-binding protein [Aureobasidium pullulans]|uniref:NAD(P)-binding protein n=1 Tax=Aureobasidium pullulans TaxID=5580 RepID=A0A4S9PFB2_AURPU|nr:NAD(P)-binding protein [Aureobasidium pullulans]THZ35510.1 NAD(P)-binding protein [Aureobasidium pullulans]THZ49983.1 NAD(P)-binding protein [Aureobasidium pullulans]THZ51340.1 NAD(P)-binding protein [Aureobasidium pullulans]